MACSNKQYRKSRQNYILGETEHLQTLQFSMHTYELGETLDLKYLCVVLFLAVAFFLVRGEMIGGDDMMIFNGETCATAEAVEMGWLITVAVGMTVTMVSLPIEGVGVLAGGATGF